MYTFHYEFMPKKIQQPLLDDLERLGPDTPKLVVRSSYREAKEWFTEAVARIRGKALAPYSINPMITQGWSAKGEAKNIDIHWDNHRLHSEVVKFVITIANHDHLGTIFYRNMASGMYGIESPRLFELNDGRLMPTAQARSKFDWEQARVGQVISFTVADQLHSAPPVFPGDHKILLGTEPLV